MSIIALAPPPASALPLRQARPRVELARDQRLRRGPRQTASALARSSSSRPGRRAAELAGDRDQVSGSAPGRG